MGYDHDRVLGLEVQHQLLDADGRGGIERGGGLVHQDDFGLDREAARDAQALLLPAREPQGGLVEAVLDLVPERRAPQAGLHARLDLEPVTDAQHAQAEGGVLEDRLGERVGPLEHHADPAAQRHHIGRGIEDVGARQQHLPLGPHARDQVVHAVEGAQQRALAAA